MRKLRVALVILLLLAFFTVSQAAFGLDAIKSPAGIGNALSVGNTKATLVDIQKKLASGSSDIAQENQVMSAWVKYKAGQNIGNTSKKLNTNVGTPKTGIQMPSTKGMSVPMSGIGSAVKSLGNIGFSMKSPVTLAKSMAMPKLAILE
jgi:hypothetical protein